MPIMYISIENIKKDDIQKPFAKRAIRSLDLFGGLFQLDGDERRDHGRRSQAPGEAHRDQGGLGRDHSPLQGARLQERREQANAQEGFSPSPFL